MPRKDMKDYTGQRFGRWFVLAHVPRGGKPTFWECVCDCGTRRTVTGDSLRRGRSRSCGCLMRETTAAQAKRLFTKHGHTVDYLTSTEYHSWAGMVARCTNPKHTGFHNYGGRGIKVCRRWRMSFTNFLADMGRKPSRAHTIDRIDNDGNYTPSNCKWSTRKEQANNSRRWRHLTVAL